MNSGKNIEMLEIVAKGLGKLVEQVVFIGGATTAIYIDDPAAPDPSPSEDVDCLIEATSLIEYSKFEKALAKLKFKKPMGDDQTLICRWEYLGITVDVMPTAKKILGFSNRWYPDGFKTKQNYTLPKGTVIHVLSPEYFLATKFEAFNSRGGNDVRMSHDMEDIIAVIDGSEKTVSAVQNAAPDVKTYLESQFKSLLKDVELLEEAIGGYLRGAGDTSKRARIVVEKFKAMI